MRKFQRLLLGTKRFCTAWFCGWGMTYCLASLAHSSQVLAALHAIDVEVPIALAAKMCFEDLWGLLLGYGSLLLVVTGVLYATTTKFLPWRYASIYLLLGALAMAAMLLAMQPLLNVTLIAGARSPLGFFLQCAAGSAGAWVFYRLSTRT